MSNKNQTPRIPVRRGLGLGANLLAAGVVFLAVLVPFLFWQQTWFGTALSDQEIRKNLNPSARPPQDSACPGATLGEGERFGSDLCRQVVSRRTAARGPSHR